MMSDLHISYLGIYRRYRLRVGLVIAAIDWCVTVDILRALLAASRSESSRNNSVTFFFLFLLGIVVLLTLPTYNSTTVPPRPRVTTEH